MQPRNSLDLAAPSKSLKPPYHPLHAAAICLLWSFGVALGFNLALNLICLRLSPEFFGLSPIIGSLAGRPFADAVVEGIFGGLWQGTLLGGCLAIAIMFGGNRLKLSHAVGLVVGSYALLALIDGIVIPLTARWGGPFGRQLPAVLLSLDEDRVYAAYAVLRSHQLDTLIVICAVVPLSALDRSQEKARERARARRAGRVNVAQRHAAQPVAPRDRSRGSQNIRNLPAPITALLIGLVAPFVLAFVGAALAAFLPGLPPWLTQETYILGLAMTVLATDFFMTFLLRCSLNGKAKRPPKTKVEYLRLPKRTPLSSRVLGALSVFGVLVGILALPLGRSVDFAMGAICVAFAPPFAKLFWAAALDVRASRRRRGGGDGSTGPTS